jgi:AcrR family transcriptional regulator
MSAARDRLLDAAAALFGERGYECVGINEIIARASIAKATFYQHFPSKEELCAAWLRDKAEKAVSAQRALLDDPRPVRVRLEEHFDRLAEAMEQKGFPGCPFCVTAAMTPPGSGLRAPVEEHRAQARIAWRELASQHEPRKKKARQLGDGWFLLHTGAITEAQSVRARWPIKRAKRAALVLGGWK